jgi:hypothetical protein
MRISPLRTSLAVAAALLLSAGGAHAEDESRQVKAKRACAAGRVEEGVEILAALYAESGDVNYVYNQGRCYQQNGRVDQALNRFREYLRRATGASEQERAEVRGFIEELERQRERTSPPQPERPADQGARSGRLRTAGVTLAVVGVAAVGTGVVLSLKVRGSARDVERYVRDTQPYADPQVVAGKMRSGGRLETFQWVAYGAGVAALAGGVSCYLLDARPSEERRLAFTVAPGPRGFAASMRLRF